MAEPSLIAGYGEYGWMPFYVRNLADELHIIFDVVFNISSDLDPLSNILKTETYESEVVNWLKTLKSALYEVEDMLDLIRPFEKITKKRLMVVARLRSRPFIRPFEKITMKILKRSSQRKDLFFQMKRLCDLVSESSFLSGALGILDHPLNASQPKETSSNLINPVFGCDVESELLLGQICQDPDLCSQGYSVVAIVGQPGSGKTTLAQYIFNHKRIVGHFKTRIWLYVSQKLDLFHHTSKMVESVLKEDCTRFVNLDVLQRKLEQEVGSSNTLLVLDDVWGSEIATTASVMDDVLDSRLANNTIELEQMFVDETHWEQLLAPFSRYSRCKILVTSQSCKLPFPLRSSGIYHKNTMKEQDFFDLLMHTAFRHEIVLPPDVERIGHEIIIPPDVKRIGHEIVKRLRFPGDAKLIGSQLRAQTDVKAWEKVLERVNLSSPHELNLKPTDIYLQLNEQLKRCFLFCSIFPKGYKHEMDNLIQLWVAECFIKCLDPDRRADIGKEYFQELLTSSVFKPIQEQESDIVLYTMDDLFHHLADHMSVDDCFRLEGSDRMVIPPSVYHLSVHTEKLTEHRSYICNLHNLRTLILFGPVIDDSYEILEEIFFNLKKLRVLDISLYNGNILPKSIGNLKQLRYLNHSTTITKLPKSIHKLQKLQFLNHKPDG